MEGEFILETWCTEHKIKSETTVKLRENDFDSLLAISCLNPARIGQLALSGGQAALLQLAVTALNNPVQQPQQSPAAPTAQAGGKQPSIPGIQASTSGVSGAEAAHVPSRVTPATLKSDPKVNELLQVLIGDANKLQGLKELLSLSDLKTTITATATVLA